MKGGVFMIFNKTFLDKAISNNSFITDILRLNPTDEQYITNCCYLSQQMIEYALKYILSYLDIDYKRTHNIKKLISTIESKYSFFLSELKDWADIITDWESSFRYNFNFKGTIIQVQEVQDIFIKLLQEIKSNFHQINSDDFNKCYQLYKENLILDRNTIVLMMEDIYLDNNLNTCISDNIYSTLYPYIVSYFEDRHKHGNFDQIIDPYNF